MSLFKPHKHRWTRWTDNGQVVWYLAGHVGDRSFQTKEALEQISECRDCGKKQKRYV